MTEEERRSFARSRDENETRGAIECVILHNTVIVGLASWEQPRKFITKMTTLMIPNSTTHIQRASQKHTTRNTNDPPTRSVARLIQTEIKSTR